MCSELCKDFYVVYQLEMVAGDGCDFFFFGLTLPNYRNKCGSAQRSPPSYQLLPPPLVYTEPGQEIVTVRKTSSNDCSDVCSIFYV